MNKSKIDWPWYPLWTWNPVVGCKHGCSYCYARRMNQRFKWIEKWEEPEIDADRIYEPLKRKKPTNIFAGSISDIFGEWTPTSIIEEIIKTANQCSQHTFFFLTKNPKRYNDFLFPKNCWLGTTLISRRDADRYITLQHAGINKKFVSIEPLLGHFGGMMFNYIDQVIVGAQTGPGATEPKPEWINSIKAEKIHFKKNILKYL